jgi:Pin2-interacting protein X1
MGLAGIKRKQRIAADPQNKTWGDDKSKFGYKMLQKMGWSEGKGLGKNEDGGTDHLEMEFKTDTLGLGVTKKNATEETYQQLTAFDSILKRINTEEPDSETVCKSSKKEKRHKVKKVESPIKTTGRLAHRRKFINNKRVDQYSEAHLKEILGVSGSRLD